MSLTSNPAVIIATSVFVCLIIGWSLTLQTLRKERRKHSNLSKFRDLFIEWCNSRCTDDQRYVEIIKLSPQIQGLMSEFGTITYRPPFANYVVNNWQIILNAIPEINEISKDPFTISGSRIYTDRLNKYILMVEESLLRSIGNSENFTSEILSQMWNPLSMLFRGLKFVITLPFLVLAECGLLTSKAYNFILNSVIVKSISLAIFFIGFASSVVTITTGWDQFQTMVKPWLSNFGLQ